MLSGKNCLFTNEYKKNKKGLLKIFFDEDFGKKLTNLRF